MTIGALRVKLFQDGADLADMIAARNRNLVSGFTTNPTLMRRAGITDAVMFGSHEYSREELIAEMGSAFLAGHCGIDTATLPDAAAYVASWLRVLNGDKRMVVVAAAQAQKAADFILGVQHEDGGSKSPV